MAHEIDKSKGINAAWSNKLVSWHKLGSTEETNDPDKILKLSGLDFEVKREPIYLASGKVIEDNYSNVRQDTGASLGIVGSRYVITQNSEAFSFFSKIFGKEDIKFETAGALKGGKIIYVTGKLKEGMKINGADPHDMYLNFYNIHDGSGSIRIFNSLTRIVCNNTLSAALAEKKKGSLNIRHTANQTARLNQAKDLLKISKEQLQEKKEFLETISKKSLSTQVTKELALQLIADYGELDRIANKEEVVDVLSTRKLNIYNNILYSIDNGVGQKDLENSCYKFLNGVTYYTSNIKDIKNSDEDKQYNTFFGSSLQLQEKAMELVLNY